MDVYNLKQMWGALALEGAIAIMFGIAAVFWPGLTLGALVYLFAAFILVSGLVHMFVGLTNFKSAGRSGWGRIGLFVLGLLELGLGVYLVRNPLVTFGTLILLISLMFLIRGIFSIFSGIFGEGGGLYKVVTITVGVLAILAGIFMINQPASAGVAFVWVLGLWSLITGPMMIALAVEAKNAAKELEQLDAVPVAKARR